MVSVLDVPYCFTMFYFNCSLFLFLNCQIGKTMVLRYKDLEIHPKNPGPETQYRVLEGPEPCEGVRSDTCHAGQEEKPWWAKTLSFLHQPSGLDGDQWIECETIQSNYTKFSSFTRLESGLFPEAEPFEVQNPSCEGQNPMRVQ